MSVELFLIFFSFYLTHLPSYQVTSPTYYLLTYMTSYLPFYLPTPHTFYLPFYLKPNHPPPRTFLSSHPLTNQSGCLSTPTSRTYLYLPGHLSQLPHHLPSYITNPPICLITSATHLPISHLLTNQPGYLSTALPTYYACNSLPLIHIIQHLPIFISAHEFNKII